MQCRREWRHSWHSPRQLFHTEKHQLNTEERQHNTDGNRVRASKSLFSRVLWDVEEACPSQTYKGSEKDDCITQILCDSFNYTWMEKNMFGQTCLRNQNKHSLSFSCYFRSRVVYVVRVCLVDVTKRWDTVPLGMCPPFLSLWTSFPSKDFKKSLFLKVSFGSRTSSLVFNSAYDMTGSTTGRTNFSFCRQIDRSFTEWSNLKETIGASHRAST